MKGLITSRELVTHAITIVRLWGLATYLRCLRAVVSRRPTTFLAIACASARSSRDAPAPVGTVHLGRRCAS